MSDALEDHYGRDKLLDSILRTLHEAGRDVDALTRDDLAGFEEFHLQGREGTRELARLAEIGPDDQVLDVACGLGGAARTLAAEIGCRVTGIDLTESCIEAAVELTRRVGLAERVSFRHGDALELPFDDGAFDVVWLQHMQFNVEEKARLLAGIARVLCPGGRVALHEIFAGPGGPLHFPVPFDPDGSLSHMIAPEAFLELAGRAGLQCRHWRDITARAGSWVERSLASLETRPVEAPSPLGPNVVMGPRFFDVLRVLLRNLREDRARVLLGVLEKSTGQ
ncbi:MAG TPA: methyltransferase domain-containing protein [Gammaproteobacteria bacterium]|nr:methyltransferase domain-containing protein [Gammaproteobacteria bacterium]